MTHIILLLIYLSFISLGLPDGVLGSAWPSMYPDFGVPVSYAGIVSFLIAMGTVISSLLSDRLTARFGAGKVTAVSVSLTALGLIGFASCREYWQILLITVPYGIGAGSVDAALNNYVALHYAARHMSWLHCMWGLGTIVGPYAVSFALSGGHGWRLSYVILSIVQGCLALTLLTTLPIWKKQGPRLQDRPDAEPEAPRRAIPLKQVVRIKGAWEIMVTFFCYCGLEAIAILWSASYMVLYRGQSEEVAAGLASLFFIGITVGRALCGILTSWLDDTTLIRIGSGIIALGCILMMLPIGGITVTVIGLVLMGLGCAPIYPSIIHSTPIRFGADRSQALIGVQMASAYVGTACMPPLFGILAEQITPMLFPFAIALLLILMILMHERVLKQTKA